MSIVIAKGFPGSGRMTGTAMLLCGLLLSEAGQAGQPGWVPIRTTPSGQIYHRDSGHPSIPWARIVTQYAASPARVHAMVTDYDHFTEFIPNVTESRIVSEAGSNQWVYHHLHFPGPIADRAYLIKSNSSGSRPEEQYFRVAWELADRELSGVDLTTGIRPDAFSGYWEIHPGESPGSTVAHYAIFSDPGGFIPGWLVVAHTDRYIQQVVEAIRERLVMDE